MSRTELKSAKLTGLAADQCVAECAGRALDNPGTAIRPHDLLDERPAPSD